MQVVVRLVDHTSVLVAREIHAIHMAAYAQEAELIEAIDFPPLSRTVEDLRSSFEQFLGVYAGAELVGAASLEPEGPRRIGISSFVVSPKWQRQGVGRALLQRIIELQGHQELRVQTAARNVPALALYRSSGFVEVRRWFAGTQPLELVALLCPLAKSQNVA